MKLLKQLMIIVTLFSSAVIAEEMDSDILAGQFVTGENQEICRNLDNQEKRQCERRVKQVKR